MKRIKLADRQLPDYTQGEELFNSISHICGAAFSIAALVFCILVPAGKGDVWGVVGGTIYGASLIVLYTMSSVYHGLSKCTAKKVMQILDHCSIFFLIAGTYTPIVLGPIRRYSAGWGWTIFGVVWLCAIFGATLTAIDLKKYSKFSMICYLGMGWCIVLAANVAIKSVAAAGLGLILIGGILYTFGAVLYGLGRHHRYMHSVFHLFVLAGSIFQFIAIILYII